LDDRVALPLEPGASGCEVVVKPVFKPFMPKTPTVPGFRLDRDLTRGKDKLQLGHDPST